MQKLYAYNEFEHSVSYGKRVRNQVNLMKVNPGCVVFFFNIALIFTFKYTHIRICEKERKCPLGGRKKSMVKDGEGGG